MPSGLPRGKPRDHLPSDRYAPRGRAIGSGDQPDGAVRCLGETARGSRTDRRAVRRPTSDRTLPAWLAAVWNRTPGRPSAQRQLTLPPAATIRSASAMISATRTDWTWRWQSGKAAQVAWALDVWAVGANDQVEARSAFAEETTATLARPWTRRHSGPGRQHMRLCSRRLPSRGASCNASLLNDGLSKAKRGPSNRRQAVPTCPHDPSTEAPRCWSRKNIETMRTIRVIDHQDGIDGDRNDASQRASSPW